jgi:hypothetical protein
MHVSPAAVENAIRLLDSRHVSAAPGRQRGDGIRNRRKSSIGKAENWLRGRDLNPRPLGYEPNELPDCSTPRHVRNPQCNTDRSVIDVPKRCAAAAPPNKRARQYRAKRTKTAGHEHCHTARHDPSVRSRRRRRIQHRPQRRHRPPRRRQNVPSGSHRHAPQPTDVA